MYIYNSYIPIKESKLLIESLCHMVVDKLVSL